MTLKNVDIRFPAGVLGSGHFANLLRDEREFAYQVVNVKTGAFVGPPRGPFKSVQDAIDDAKTWTLADLTTEKSNV